MESKTESSYLELTRLLEETSKKSSVPAMIPLGKHGLIPGEFIHTQKVLVSLGNDWFVNVSAKDAKDILSRRKEDFETTSNKSIKASLEDSNRSSQVQKLFEALHSTKESVNEDGLEFVEIRESFDENVHGAISKPVIGEKPISTESRKMHSSEFETNLFKLMDDLELEEASKEESLIPYSHNSEDESKSEMSESESESDDHDNVDEIDNNEDPIEFKSEPLDNPQKNSLETKRVRFSEKIEETTIIPSREATSCLPPASSKEWIPIRDLVLENDFSDYEQDEEDLNDDDFVEDYQLGRQIALEYQKKRNKLQLANLISRDLDEENHYSEYDAEVIPKNESEVRPVLETAGRGLDRFKPKTEQSKSTERVSRFKATRLRQPL